MPRGHGAQAPSSTPWTCELAVLMAVADAYGTEDVCAAVEEAVLARLSADRCADAPTLARNSGLGRVEAGCRAVALVRFEAVAGTAGLGRLDATARAALPRSISAAARAATGRPRVRWRLRLR